MGVLRHRDRYRIKSMALRQSPCIIPLYVVKLFPISAPILTFICGLFVIMLNMWSSSSFKMLSSSWNSICLFTVLKAFDISSSSRCNVKSLDAIAFPASVFTAKTCSVVLLPGW